MSELSGNLADFELSAVIRLLAAGKKTGILVVNGPHLDGSLFFEAGALTYATTRRNAARTAREDEDRREAGPRQADALIADVTTRLKRQGRGTFTFQADVHPVHSVDTSFPVNRILKMVEERLAVWQDVDDAIGSTDQPYRLTAGANDDARVQLHGSEWNLIAAVGSGSSVTELASRLRLPDLQIAEMVVALKERGLMEAAPEKPRPVATVNTHGGRLYQPDPDDLVIDLTEREPPPEPKEAPASELAARWRDLRNATREDLEQPG